MKIAFTPTVAYRFIKKAKANFNRHKFAPKEWKDILAKLKVYVCIEEIIEEDTTCMAMSWMMNDYYGKLYGIDPTDPKTRIGKKDWWLVLGFKAEVACTADSRSLYNLVVHELSHSLDYVIRGKMQPSDSGSHDSFFEVLVSMMGGVEEYRNPYRKALQKRIKKSIASFGGQSVVAKMPIDI